MQEGFGDRQGGEFYSIKNGVLAKRCKETDEGAVKQTKQDGTPYYEVQKSDFTGYLTGVRVKTHDEYGDFLVIQMKSKGQKFNFETNLDNGYAFGFLSTIPNADLEALLMISPSYNEKDGKKQSKLFLQQDSGWLKQYFTRENPNGLPELVKIKVKGKETWDSTERLEYFKQMIVGLNNKLQEIHGSNEEVEEVETNKVEAQKVKAPF